MNTESPHFLIPVVAGIVAAMILFFVVTKLFSRANRSNPLLGLLVIGGTFYFLSGTLEGMIPSAWLEVSLTNPLGNASTIGNFMGLQGEKISPYQLLKTTIFGCFIVFFFYSFLSKWKS
jgi:hypothetical protein